MAIVENRSYDQPKVLKIVVIILMLLKMIKTLIFFRVSEVVIQELNDDGVSFVEGSSPTVGIFES